MASLSFEEIQKSTDLNAKIEWVLESDDTELMHMVEDTIYTDFIESVANGDIWGSDVKAIAMLIKRKLIDVEREKWYS